MKRRSGVTLVEVLVAIFVMGIGLIALLTLFPIGILRMVQAIRDARSAQACGNAVAVAIAQDIKNDPAVFKIPGFPNLGPGDPYKTDGIGRQLENADLFFNPAPMKNGAVWPALGTLPNADMFSESYPIFVDPFGYNASATGVGQDWVGGNPSGALRRRPVAFTGGVAANIHQNFTLWDDINFDATGLTAPPGTPQQIAPTIINRDTRFSWAYLLRRPQTGDRSVVDCTVVVFEKRPLSLNNNLSLSEYVYPNMAYFNPANSTITIEYTSPTVVAPPLRPGNWILDTTSYFTTPTTGTASAFFYRVVGTEEFIDTTVSPNRRFARYEVQTPKFFPLGINSVYSKYPFVADPLNAAAGPAVYQGTVIVMEGITEVYEKGPMRMP